MQKVICPICKTNDAVKDDYYGYLPCEECRKKQSKLQKPSRAVEFTSESIKEQRKAYGHDIWGRHRKGVLSKEYIERFGTARLKGFTKEEIKNAKYVWNDEKYYKS